MDKPEWFIRMLNNLASTIERDVRNHRHDKYSVGMWAQRRENLKYAARYIEFLTKVKADG